MKNGLLFINEKSGTWFRILLWIYDKSYAILSIYNTKDVRREVKCIMANTLAVAKYLNNLNKKNHGSNMDQLEMHKLMYLTQREALMVNDAPMFDGDFEAWRYGPVSLEVRKEYLTGHMFESDYGALTKNEREVTDSVYNRYEKYSPWDLSTLTHEEYSWKQARTGLKPNDQSHNKLTVSAIKVDAKRELLRRQGVVL